MSILAEFSNNLSQASAKAMLTAIAIAVCFTIVHRIQIGCIISLCLHETDISKAELIIDK
ncbi:MAG: hypothetical protein RMZ69_13855 [Nostoc sp. ChiQUE01a]|nr:hypothetical protein [Nostoc sp. ChiQUE01a]